MTDKDTIVPNLVIYKHNDIVAKTQKDNNVFVRSLVLALWPIVSRFPLGKRLASLMFGLLFPFFGTIGCRIEEFDRGRAKVSVKNSWRIRDYNGRIDASILVGLQRIVSALSLASVLEYGLHPFLDEFTISYLSSPEGDISAICSSGQAKPGLFQNVVSFSDSTGAFFAHGKCSWNIRRAL